MSSNLLSLGQKAYIYTGKYNNEERIKIKQLENVEGNYYYFLYENKFVYLLFDYKTWYKTYFQSMILFRYWK